MILSLKGLVYCVAPHFPQGMLTFLKPYALFQLGDEAPSRTRGCTASALCSLWPHAAVRVIHLHRLRTVQA